VVAVGNPALLGLGNYIGPKIATVYAERGSREMRAYVRRCSLAFAGALLPLGIGLLVAGDKVLVRMYGKLYAGNGTVVTLLGFNLVLTALFYPYSRGLFALRRPKADTVANLAAITILFTVGIEAVKTYGDVGAAAALLLTTAATGLLRVRALRQESARLAPPAPNVEAAEMAQA
jgi:O-antigen/teichoic acid export membrane protein